MNDTIPYIALLLNAGALAVLVFQFKKRLSFDKEQNEKDRKRYRLSSFWEALKKYDEILSNFLKNNSEENEAKYTLNNIQSIGNTIITFTEVCFQKKDIKTTEHITALISFVENQNFFINYTYLQNDLKKDFLNQYKLHYTQAKRIIHKELFNI